MLNQNQIAELKQQNPLELLIGQHVQLRNVSGELKGPCPLSCSGGDDRFVIFPGGDRYWCRQCEANGDVLDFVMAKYSLSFREAIAHLGGEGASNPSPPLRLVPSNEPKVEDQADPFDEISQHERRELIQSFQEELDDGLGNTDAVYDQPESLFPLTPLQYLYCLRMLEPDAVAKYALGYNSEPFELSGRRMPPGITIPLMQGKQIVGIKVRTFTLFDEDGEPLPDDQQYPKYWRIGKGSYTQNKESLTQFDTVLIAEGEFDGMLLDQTLGNKYACISFGGTSDFKKANLGALLFDASRVFWCFDGDSAGYSAAKKIDGTNKRYRKLQLPEGEDVTSYFLKTGTRVFIEYIETAMLGGAK